MKMSTAVRLHGPRTEAAQAKPAAETSRDDELSQWPQPIQHFMKAQGLGGALPAQARSV